MSIKRSVTIKKNCSGFTLVEVILVIVILAVIMAFLIPALMGFIKKAKDKQDLLDAKTCLTSLQTELSELYVRNGDSLKPGYFILGNDNVQLEKTRTVATKNGDTNATDKPFAESVLYMAGIKGDKSSDDPYCIVFGVGSNWNTNTKADDKTTQKDKYTVYYLFYMREKHSTPLFYYNGEWTNSHPRSSMRDNSSIDEYNYIQSGPKKGMRLQYYCISNQAYKDHGSFGKPDFWNWIRSL